jgi:hypothetical protein
MTQLGRRKGRKLQKDAKLFKENKLIWRNKETHLWTTAILVHGNFQLQRLIPPHLNDVVDSELDFFSRQFLLGVALRIVNPAISAHQGWAILERLNPL